MTKIGLFLDAGPACGGTYQYNHLMLEALMDLSKTDYECVVFYGAEHWQAILAKNHMRGRLVRVPRLWQILAGAWRRSKLPLAVWRRLAKIVHPLARLMLKEQCDLWIFPSQDAYAYLMPVPALAAVHDLMHRYESRFPEVGEPAEYARREYHYRNTCRWAKGILVDSTLGRNQAVESYQINPQACYILPYIANRHIESIQPSADFEQKYALPEKFFFYPAQFWQHKNHENLLKALAECQKEIPDIQLVLVGSPKNHYDTVKALITELKLESAVHILGLVDEQDMPELYRRARALVMPTFFGPTNIPPLEAFALGTPVAISGIYGMQEQLGDAAVFFDPESVSEIAEQLKQLWRSDPLCENLVAKGIKHRREAHFAQFEIKVNLILAQVCRGLKK